VDQMPSFDRITQEPGKMGGRACIRRLRVTVSMIVGQIGAGRTDAEILADYPYLEAEDLSQALRYAACRAGEVEITLGEFSRRLVSAVTKT
jgi:uncharacterized protein (DUF433 family)